LLTEYKGRSSTWLDTLAYHSFFDSVKISKTVIIFEQEAAISTLFAPVSETLIPNTPLQERLQMGAKSAKAFT
jgi:hypothetical protein